MMVFVCRPLRRRKKVVRKSQKKKAREREKKTTTKEKKRREKRTRDKTAEREREREKGGKKYQGKKHPPKSSRSRFKLGRLYKLFVGLKVWRESLKPRRLFLCLLTPPPTALWCRAVRVSSSKASKNAAAAAARASAATDCCKDTKNACRRSC